MKPQVPFAGLVLVGMGVATIAALPSLAADPPPRLYFHSVNGDYAMDAANDPAASAGGRSPDGAGIDENPPQSENTSKATTYDPLGVVGSAIAPTFKLPDSGTVGALCVDIWASSSTAVDELTANLYIQTGNNVVGNVEETFAEFTALTVDYTEGIVRMTGTVTTPTPYALAPETTLSFLVGAPGEDFTLHYDSLTHYSSITLNPSQCVPLNVDGEPDGTAPTATPTGTVTGSPDPEPTVTESAEPTLEPTVSPSVSAPASRASEVTYTGLATARYGDTVTFAAKVTDDAGLPITGGSVTFELGRTKYTAQVGSDGKAKITARVNETPETYLLETRYSGTTGVAPSAVQDGFVVAKGASVCSLQRGSSSTNSTLIAVLSRPDTARIGNAPVTFLHQNRSVGSARTDSRGVARTETAPKGKAGDTFSVTFAGNAHHTGCRKDLKI